MSYQYILFDLDGTLTDSAEGVINGVAYALGKFGIHETDRAKLFTFIGPPLTDSFQKHYDFTLEQGLEASGYYRDYYGDKGMYENRVYEGIPELLQHLKDAGKTLIVATTKGENYAKAIVDHFGLSRFFDYVGGQVQDGLPIPKAVTIERIIRDCGIADTAQAVMIGDREHDIFAARECQMDGIAILYGYGSREEMEASGAVKIAENMADLERYLLD